MEQIIKKLKSLNRLDDQVEKHTLVIDDKQIEHGVLFFIPLDKFSVKVLIPAPFHQSFLQDKLPTFREILNHR
ncbi:MAG: hypothetical protein ACRDE7_06540, partial [Sphingobacterium sp.]